MDHGQRLFFFHCLFLLHGHCSVGQDDGWTLLNHMRGASRSNKILRSQASMDDPDPFSVHIQWLIILEREGVPAAGSSAGLQALVYAERIVLLSLMLQINL